MLGKGVSSKLPVWGPGVLCYDSLICTPKWFAWRHAALLNHAWWKKHLVRKSNRYSTTLLTLKEYSMLRCLTNNKPNGLFLHRQLNLTRTGVGNYWFYVLVVLSYFVWRHLHQCDLRPSPLPHRSSTDPPTPL